ncbi:3-isopropylmalate dehydratase large subunit (plasmid) [Buchnera aphidicola (Ceratoglyphina bambusae)]|uniref:3-isopropylmalate dehydratase large subunit n=1 Tax=Buchnera aphidicola TaxID=9 RepID=UPI0031B7EE7E
MKNKKTTLYEKLYNSHVIYEKKNETPLIYIDLHLLHEVTSPQAFYSLKEKFRDVRRPEKTFATMDHNVPTKKEISYKSNKMSFIQMEELKKNCKYHNIKLFDLNHPKQGIVHVIGPELGLTLPGTTIVCGDSHTSTHGAFGSLAFGIGTSEVEHVLATQTLSQIRYKNMKIKISGKIPKYVYSKDIILHIIKNLSTSIGSGYIIEFYGNTISNISMESRMTICNMAVELGAKSGIISPDKVTYKYLKNKEYSPKGNLWKKLKKYWKTLKSDKNSFFDKKFYFNIKNLSPQITWGTNPSQTINIEDKIPLLNNYKNVYEKRNVEHALKYMRLKPGEFLKNLSIDKVFIGSCTNSRIEDLREASKIIINKKVHKNVKAIVVPGSKCVKLQAEKEGIDKIFIESGFEWRNPGCSMCLAMNDDKLNEGERCVSTSNRNFEGRQGRNSMTHLVSPAMAAAAAVYGKIVDIREI